MFESQSEIIFLIKHDEIWGGCNIRSFPFKTGRTCPLYPPRIDALDFLLALTMERRKCKGKTHDRRNRYFGRLLTE